MEGLVGWLYIAQLRDGGDLGHVAQGGSFDRVVYARIGQIGIGGCNGSEADENNAGKDAR